MIGYDFNGVVDTGRFIPNEEDVIITGVVIGGGLVISTLEYLQEHNIKCAVYFNPYPNGANNRELVATWKAEIINKLELKTFYEDDFLQYQIIKQCSPKCEVIKV